jgi:hypothetical protein
MLSTGRLAIEVFSYIMNSYRNGKEGQECLTLSRFLYSLERRTRTQNSKLAARLPGCLDSGLLSLVRKVEKGVSLVATLCCVCDCPHDCPHHHNTKNAQGEDPPPPLLVPSKNRSQVDSR